MILPKPQLNHNSTQPYPNITLVEFDMEMTLHITLKLSCHWPDFGGTLKEDSWEHIEQIPTVAVIFIQATYVLATFVDISNISAVTNQTFWNNFFWGYNFVSWLGPNLFGTKISRQSQGKVRTRSREDQDKVKEISRQG